MRCYDTESETGKKRPVVSAAASPVSSAGLRIQEALDLTETAPRPPGVVHPPRKAIRRHREGILHSIRLGINQGRTEALVNKVRLITRRPTDSTAPKPHSPS